jgi:hypothetical protein
MNCALAAIFPTYFVFRNLSFLMSHTQQIVTNVQKIFC